MKNMKGRIVMKCRRPTIWVSIIAMIAVMAVCVGMTANPKSEEASLEPAETINASTGKVDEISTLTIKETKDAEFAIPAFYNENLMEVVNREHLYTVVNEYSDKGNADYGLDIKLYKYFVTDETMAFIFSLSGDMLDDIGDSDYVVLDYKIIDRNENIIYNTANPMGLSTVFAVQGRNEEQIILESAMVPVNTDTERIREQIALTDSITLQIYGVTYYDSGISYQTADAAAQLNGSWAFKLNLDTSYINMPIKTYEIVDKEYATAKGITINQFTSSLLATQVDITFDTDKNDYPLAPSDFAFFVKLNEDGKLVMNTNKNTQLAVESTMAIMASGKDVMQEGGFEQTALAENTGSSVRYSFSIYSPTIYLDNSGYVTMCFADESGEVIEIVLKVTE